MKHLVDFLRPVSASSIFFALLPLGAPAGFAQEPKPNVRLTPDGKWHVHSLQRPRPEVVEPQYDGQPVKVPAGAVVLFDGSDLSRWRRQKPDPETGAVEAHWKVENGYFQVQPKGGIETREPLRGDGHLHIEWATPAEVKGNGQGRGNSGVFVGGYPEVQVLDSWQNDTYPDGQASAFYGQYPPRVNASRKPGEWQVYDLVIERARQEGSPRKQRMSVWHNGVLVHENVEFDGNQKEGLLGLQDHGNPMRFRNVWFLPAAAK
jgi:hypothetical protein